MNLGHNRKTNLQDDAGFLAAYRMNFEGKVRTGGEEEFRSIQQAARILSRQGKHYEVLKPFVHIDKALQADIGRTTTCALQGDLFNCVDRRQKVCAAYLKALAKPGVPLSGSMPLF